MSEIEVFNKELDETTCWALLRRGVPCPNEAKWKVENTTNEGYSFMCNLHKEIFALEYPDAYVRYISLPISTDQYQSKQKEGK